MGGKKIYPRLIHISKGASFRQVSIKLVKIINSLISSFAFWTD